MSETADELTRTLPTLSVSNRNSDYLRAHIEIESEGQILPHRFRLDRAKVSDRAARQFKWRDHLLKIAREFPDTRTNMVWYARRHNWLGVALLQMGEL